MPFQRYVYQQECLKQGDILPVQDQFHMSINIQIDKPEPPMAADFYLNESSIEPKLGDNKGQVEDPFLLTDKEFLKQTEAIRKMKHISKYQNNGRSSSFGPESSHNSSMGRKPY